MYIHMCSGARGHLPRVPDGVGHPGTQSPSEQIYIYIYNYTTIHVCIHMCIYIYIHVYMYMCIYVYIHTYLFVYLFIYSIKHNQQRPYGRFP